MQLLDILDPDKLRERLSQPFDPGDTVIITSGHWEGETGSVVDIQGPMVTVRGYWGMREYDQRNLRLES